MSLQGEINKISGDFKRGLANICGKEFADLNGSLIGTQKIFGYVCQIHEDGELAGTIDVQEYNYLPGEYEYKGAGHHKGVLLSAIQENTEGVKIVPMLFSEVVIVLNPLDRKEYVLMYSHARRIQMMAHSTEGSDEGQVKIGVTEVEKFVESDNGLDKDYFELEPTKNASSTLYSATSIVNSVTSKEDEEGLKEELTSAQKTIMVGNTKIVIDGDNISIETDSKITYKVGGTSIEEQDGQITIKTDNAKIESSNCQLKGDNVKVEGSNVTITGGTLQTQGTSSVDLNGPFNAIKVCPFSGAPHCGSIVSGT